MSDTQNNIIRFNYSVDPTTLMSNSWITTNTDTTQNTVTGIDPETVTTTYRDVTYSIEDLSHNPIASGVLRVVYAYKDEFYVESVTVLSGSSIDRYGAEKGDLLIGIDKNEYIFSDFASAPENTTQTTSESTYTNTWSYVNGSSTETIYDHYEVELYVNSDVTTFPNNLFYADSNITSVEFDTYSITSIEDGSKGSSGAFLHCVNLVSIILPNNIEYIGDFAAGGTGISQITLPSTLEEIGSEGLNGVFSITSLATVPPTIHTYSISNTATLTIHQTALQSYINSDWADYVTSIDTIETPTYSNVLKFNYSVDPTTSLNNLWVNSCTDTSANTIECVGKHTEEVTVTHYWRTITFDFTRKAPFAGVFKIEVDGNGVPVQPYNFESLSGDEVTYFSYNKEYDTVDIGNDESVLNTLSNFSTAIENQVYTEDTGTWSYVASTTTTTETVTVYDHYEVTLYINSALNTFETTMFADNENITSVEFDYNVTSIIDDAFNGCENLSSVTLTSPVPPTIGEDTFSLISPDAVLYVPTASIPAYQTAGFGDYFGEIRGTSPEPPTPFRGYGFNRTNMIDIDYLNEVFIRRN